MLVLDSGDALRGIAEVATKLDFIVNGYVGTTATQLADGQLGTSEADLYASGADGTVVTSITVVNTDSAARTFTLYLKPSNGGTSRAITPVSLDLGIGHSFYTDGQRTVVMDKSGNILSTTTVLSHDLGGSSHDADTLSNLNGKISDATLASLAGTEELTNKTLNAMVAKGTWTASGTWTLPPFTLGGDISGNGKSITNLHDLGIANGYGILIGHSSRINAGGSTSELQVLGTTAHDSAAIFGRWGSGFGGRIYIVQSRHGSVGSFSASNSGDVLGYIYFVGDDGDSYELGAQIRGVTTQLWEAGKQGSKLEFFTVDNDTTTPDLRLTIDQDGIVNLAVALAVSGTQVVSAQGAAVADPTDAASTQARLTDLLGRLRAHGLIAT